VDLRWGAGWAGLFAAVYSLEILLRSALNGSTRWDGSALQTTMWRILAGYWGVAAVLSAVLAFLRPWLGRRGGAALAGLLGGAAVYGVIGLTVDNSSEWSVTLAVSITGGLAGLGLGVVMYDDDHVERISKEREGRRIAVIIAGGILLAFITWAMTYPPLCWLGGKYCR
jgi:hypothetical protein